MEEKNRKKIGLVALVVLLVGFVVEAIWGSMEMALIVLLCAILGSIGFVALGKGLLSPALERNENFYREQDRDNPEPDVKLGFTISDAKEDRDLTVSCEESEAKEVNADD